MKKTALWGICAALGVLFSWAALKFALPVLLPFIIALVLSRFISPPARWLYSKTKIPEKIWASLIIVAASAMLTFALWKAGTVLAREAGELIENLGKMLTDKESPLSELIRRSSDFIKKFTPRGEDISNSVTRFISEALSRLSVTAASVAGSMIVTAPSVIFSVAVTFIAVFYFTLDGKNIKKEFGKYLPGKVVKKTGDALGTVMRAVRRFLKAYLTIMLITFAELLVGFLIIGVKYAFLSALLVSIVDILPVLGTGTVLVPWAVILFLTGEGGRAVAMTALLAVMYIVRQFTEPKIVGNCAGVHPLLALVSVYAGFKLAGVGGMIVGPVILNGISVFWEEKS